MTIPLSGDKLKQANQASFGLKREKSQDGFMKYIKRQSVLEGMQRVIFFLRVLLHTTRMPQCLTKEMAIMP